MQLSRYWACVASIAWLACKSDPPAATTAPAPRSAAPDAATPAGPDMCELFFRAVERLADCAEMRAEMRATYDKLAREAQSAPERPYGAGTLAKCQMSLHMLRIDVKLDCPALVREIPYVEIP